MTERPTKDRSAGTHPLGEMFCTCALIRRSARQITQVYDAALRDAGLRITQYSILANLERLESASITDLADALVMDRTTLTRNLRPLQRDGLVRLEDGPDNRSKALVLTARGRELLKRARPLWRGAEKALRRKVGDEDIDALRSLLGRVVPIV